MRKPNKLKWTLLSLLLFSLIKCVSAPPDIYVFEDLEAYSTTDPSTQHQILNPSPACWTAIQEMACGHGIAIISGKEIFVGDIPVHFYNGKSWTQLKEESIYMPAAESYAPLATYTINTCKIDNCSASLENFKVKLDELNGIAPLLNAPGSP